MNFTEELAAKTLYVGNLAAGSNETLLRIIFEQCGPIASIRIAGRPDFDTCFAFVEFVDQGHAEFAKALDGLLVGDRNLKVSTAKASSLARHVDHIMRTGPDRTSLPYIQAQAQARLMAAMPGGLLHSHQEQLPFQRDNGPLLDPPFQPQFSGPLSQPLSRPQLRAPQLANPQVFSSSRSLYPDPLASNFLPGPPFSGPMDLPPLRDFSGPRDFPRPLDLPDLTQHAPLAQHMPQSQRPRPQLAGQRHGNNHHRDHAPQWQNNGQRFVRPRQDPARVERTVFVENVAQELNEQGLADHFGACGEVTAVRIVGGEGASRKAWLEFSSQREAKAAREYDQTSLHANIIRVRPSKTAIHTNGLARTQYGRHRSVSPPKDRRQQSDERR